MIKYVLDVEILLILCGHVCIAHFSLDYSIRYVASRNGFKKLVGLGLWAMASFRKGFYGKASYPDIRFAASK